MIKKRNSRAVDLKFNQEKNSSSFYSKPGGSSLSHPSLGGVLTAIIKYFRGRRELVVVAVLGTGVITSVLFLFACLYSMIPVDGLLNWNSVRIGNDFIVFYCSALLALGGEAASAYDQVILNAFQEDVLGVQPTGLPWRYPPVYFFFLLPFTYLSYLGAFWTWSALTILGMMIVVRRITPIWYLPLLVPLCVPVAYTMVTGQNGNLTAIVIGAGMIMLPRSATVAGIIFGLLVYKPQLAVVVPFCLLAGRYYNAFISMVATVVVLVFMSWFVFGGESWIAFFHGLMSQTNLAFGTSQVLWERIPTVIITTLQIFDSSRIAWMLQACVAVFAITLTAWVWRATTKPCLRALALVASIPLISPYVWDYDMAILIIPIAFLVSESWGGKWTTGKFIVLLCMWFAEPALRLISMKIDLQLGPFLWTVLLVYAVILVKHEQGWEVKHRRPTDRRPEIL